MARRREDAKKDTKKGNRSDSLHGEHRGGIVQIDKTMPVSILSNWHFEWHCLQNEDCQNFDSLIDKGCKWF